MILDHGVIPVAWTVGVINPIYKNKGDPTRPENYRPITLLSCMGKLFTCVINNRLKSYIESNNIIHESQAGFRSGFSTSDHMFVLNHLIQYLNNQNKKLYCAFIDLKQAFDTVWREGLWIKLSKSNINGKCFNLIKNMYENIKSCVSVNSEVSNYFSSDIGVRQGENLSPLLFSLFLNDLNDYFTIHNIEDCIDLPVPDHIQNMQTFLKLFILLYADDTVLLSESSQGLQNALNTYAQYCDTWKLTVNIQKTKILIFSKGRPGSTNFTFQGNQLETVNEYKYLGILFSRTGSFNRCKLHIANQATRAMYSLLRNANRLSLPVDLQIDLFNKTIKPILLYGSEIWGYGNNQVIERVQLKSLKYILKLKRSTPNYMVYGESGAMPLSVDIDNRMVAFWTRLMTNTDNNIMKLSSKIYNIMHNYSIHLNDQILKKKYPWLHHLKSVVVKCGLNNIWEIQDMTNPIWVKAAVKQKLQDLFINEWFSLIETSSNATFYRIFKTKFGMESFLCNYLSKNLQYLIKFRTRNHRLPVEIGNWNRTPLNERFCRNCADKLGDEFHYLFECRLFNDARKKYLKPYYYRHPNMYKLERLINSHNKKEILNLMLFAKEIILQVR